MGIPDEANKKRTNGSDFPSRSSPIADGRMAIRRMAFGPELKRSFSERQQN